MKRSLVTTLVIGIAVAIVVGVLHATRAIAGFEAGIASLVSDYARATRVVGEKWQYVFVLLIAVGVAWLSLRNIAATERLRNYLLFGSLLVELLLLSWVCSLYQVFFQPVPCIFAVALAAAGAEGWMAFLRKDRSHLVRTIFANRLSKKEFRRVSNGTIPFDGQAKAYEATVVVCDIANRHGFTTDSDPAGFAETMAKFIRETADGLIERGAFLQAADGEGLVAIFGFPNADGQHAEEAARATLDLTKKFRDRRKDNEETFGDWDMHAGISSGAIVAGALKDSVHPALLASGEPIELARRFCALNHRYGSRILIDTATFDRVSETIVARPIDFVSGMNSHDRIEIYEPLWLATEARPEHVARRNSFWSGVVLYREKRWAEAYSEFQKARGPEGEDDPALQFYLRRLEPLVLQLTESPLEEN
ncbi:MAG TPA: adenylate/guanylate cyclase domain-containing protein [Candidatus Udaeobacter sp.]|nr:adenylate/guanylate cyclase domain-containing protein [Candidatus Udaeobacter sp.]